MATITEPLTSTEPLDVTAEFVADAIGPVTAELFEELVERGVIPQDRRVELWDGRIVEQMAKTRAHVGVHEALNRALFRRVPDDMFVGHENPVRLDPTHLPLPDLIVARGHPLDQIERGFPDGGNVLLVVEVAVTSLRLDLGRRLARYAETLPLAIYVVADVSHRQFLVHADPRPAGAAGPGGYATVTTVKPGGSLVLRLGDVDLAPIPFEEVMR